MLSKRFFVDHFVLVQPHAQKTVTFKSTVHKGNKPLCVENDITGY